MPTSHRAGPVVREFPTEFDDPLYLSYLICFCFTLLHGIAGLAFPIPANLVANSMQALQNAGINPYDAQAWQAAVLAQTAALAQASENGDPSGGLDYLLEAVLQQQPGLAMPRGDPGEEIEVVDMGLVAEDMNQQAGFPGEPEKDSPDSPPPDNDGEEVLAHDELKDEDGE